MQELCRVNTQKVQDTVAESVQLTKELVKRGGEKIARVASNVAFVVLRLEEPEVSRSSS